jgi:hypothetical protein
VTDDGGLTAIGSGEISERQINDLYIVKTDENGLVGACSEVHDPPPLTAINPDMTVASPSLPVDTTIIPGVSSPTATITTSISTLQNCGAAPSPAPPEDLVISAAITPADLRVGRDWRGGRLLAGVSVRSEIHTP